MKSLLFVIAVIVSVIACGLRTKKEPVVSPPGYDFSKPVKILVNEDLDEISGIRFMEADSSIIAINDEEGRLYKINMKGKQLGKAFKFAKKSDFEDLCFDGTYWYMIKSNGEITRVSNAFTDSFQSKTFQFPEQGWEFETILFDKGKNKIVALSKVPLQFREGRIPAFILDTTGNKFDYDPYYSIDTASITKALGKKKSECKPTAAAFHPLTGELYVLSVNDRLLVTMKEGTVAAAYKLDKTMFRQPEGISFMPNGDLLISNEAQESTGNILRFEYSLR
jgi:hypothetical protein